MILYSVVICENTVVDSQSNKLSMINCIEAINTTILPNVYPSVQIVTQWFRESKSEQDEILFFRIKIVYPSGAELEKAFEFNFNIEKDKERHRIIVNMQGIPLKEEGNMKFVIEIKSGNDWKSLGFIPVNVKKVEKI